MTEEETQSAWKILRSLKALLVITSFLLTIVIVIVVVLEIQVQTRNADIHKVRSTINETKQIVSQARESSDASERAINNAINDSNAASAANKQLVKDIQEGLASIKVNTQTLLDIQNELKPKGQ